MINLLNELKAKYLVADLAQSQFINVIGSNTIEHAYRNISFSPEKKVNMVRHSLAYDMNKDIEEVINRCQSAVQNGMTESQCNFDTIEPWINEHFLKLTAHYNTWLYRLSQTASSVITGPANFPVRSQIKKHQSADNAQAAIQEYRKKAVKYILNRALPVGDGSTIRCDDDNAVTKLQQRIKELEDIRENMKTINKIVRKHFKPTAAPLDAEKREVCFNEILSVSFVPAGYYLDDILRSVKSGSAEGFKAWQLQNLGQNIRRLKKREIELQRTQEIDVNDNFDNGVSVETSDDRKICIYFESIPSNEIRDTLKRNAFKFSRNRNNAWVRKLTANAIADYRHYVKPIIANI
jgi:hypothetical protein